ncbi:hypothetical protein KM043_007891 [Ampulex compressa]|nr:hypothetical protein KM043_007891 [Ampulex compressa]
MRSSQIPREQKPFDRWGVNMDIFESRYYRCSKYLLILIGQWPYSSWILRLFLRILVVAMGISFVSVQILQFVTCGFTSEVLMKVVPPLMLVMLVYVRYAFHWLNINLIQKLLDYIKSDWAALKSQKETKALERFADMGREYGMYYIYCIIVVVCIFLLMPLASKILDLVVPLNQSRPEFSFYEAEYIVDPEKYYYPILLHMDLTFVGGITIIASADLALLNFVMHACGSFSVVGYCFECMYDCDDDDEAKRSSALRENIAYSVNRHLRAIEFVFARNFSIICCIDSSAFNVILYQRYLKTMLSCYGTFLVVQLFFAVASLTMFLFQIVDGLKSPDKMGATVAAIGNTVFDICTIFAYIYPAQKIFDCSSELFNKAYNGRWYTAPLKVQRLLLPILRRTAQPCGLTVFGFLSASMETFSTIIRTSMSYFTFLGSLQQ